MSLTRRQFLIGAATGAAAAAVAAALPGRSTIAEPKPKTDPLVLNGVKVYSDRDYDTIFIEAGETALLAGTVEHVREIYIRGILLPRADWRSPLRIDRVTLYPGSAINLPQPIISFRADMPSIHGRRDRRLPRRTQRLLHQAARAAIA